MTFVQSILITLTCIIFSQTLHAQEIIDIWHDNAMPYRIESDVKEYQENCWEEKICVYNVVKPTLTIYPAKGANSGKAIIILPGGGYETEAITHEGYEVAEALSNYGITAAVLKYRLPNPKTSSKPELTPLADVRQAIKLLRSKTPTYGITSNKIGVLGFSAGSHLATLASVWPSNKPQENPDFAALIYGVSKLNTENLKWLEDTLYFRKLRPQEIANNTLLEQVSASTPPTFLVHAMNDDVCHYTESTLYAEALQKFNVPLEMHLFPKGGHGFGLGRASDGTDQWLNLAANWIKRL